MSLFANRDFGVPHEDSGRFMMLGIQHFLNYWTIGRWKKKKQRKIIDFVLGGILIFLITLSANHLNCISRL